MFLTIGHHHATFVVHLAAMKPGAVIVNVARGPVVDEAALYEALRQHRIGGAAIDTWDYPPSAAPRDRSADCSFHQLDNLLLSLHVAGWTTGTLHRRTLEMARNLDRRARRASEKSRLGVIAMPAPARPDSADLFAPLAGETLRAIASSGVVRQFPKNTVLINEGDQGDSISCCPKIGTRCAVE